MDYEEIFEKAVKQATENGLKLIFTDRKLYNAIINKELSVNAGLAIIFTIPFANAFWGEKSGKEHLKKMVVLESPFKYLEQFLNKN